jgi:hypothetical protein
MKITGKQTIELEVSKQELAHAIMSVILDKLEVFDDAGCDWLTDQNITYIGDMSWIVSSDENIAILVDAMNVLQYGKKLTLDS